MHEEDSRRLAEWYGVPCAAQPPARPETENAPYREPYWSAGAPDEEPAGRKKRIGVRIAGACVLAVAVIAASALLFSGGEPYAPDSGEGYAGDMREFFEQYYDDSGATLWSSSLPRAETGTGVSLALTERPEDVNLSFSEVYERCADSVVAISTETGDGRGYWGSGIIMTGDGYILTNSHLLSEAVSAVVTLTDNREFAAELVGTDPASDVAVIKINAAGLPAAEFCSSPLVVGESVAAIGNPLGQQLRGTITSGIISAISRDITYTDHPMTLIQTNAAINNGSSGGPLLNMQGQVVGMTSMKLVSRTVGSSIDGICFAIPIETLKTVADELIANGRVTGRPALGITVGSVPADAAEYYDIPDALYVTSVAPNSDAAAKGVRVGDILVTADGEHMSETADLSAVLDAKGPGRTVSLEIYRDGEMLYFDVELMEYADIYS